MSGTAIRTQSGRPVEQLLPQPLGEQLRPVGHAGPEVAERAGDEPCREPEAHGPTVSWGPPMAAPTVSTSVTELPESRVRVQAEVPAAEVEKRVAQAARALGRDMRVPGFRAGKVPPPVIIQRVGRQAVLDEAVRGSLPGWYSAAASSCASRSPSNT